jgi:dienelactone hydrolase
MKFLSRRILLGTIVVAGLLNGRCLSADDRFTGPWKMAELKQPPAAEFGKTDGLVQEVYYENVPFKGKPTRVFAYYARPATGDGPFPAMLCVHGGGGQAFREWAELWAKRGYVALAMDTAGRGPNKAIHPDGGPDQSDTGKFGDFSLETVGDMWTYHAVAAVVRGHSLLASRPEVDKERIGITGISWGGYLTCIVAGIDDRLKCAIPVYGCGFLGDNSTWLDRFAKMRPEQRDLWLDQFDPSKYLPGATCPMLFVNGTNDFAYPLDSYQKSYRLPKGPVTLCIRVRMPHGHQQGWAPIEIGIFADSIFKGGKPLPKIGDMSVGDGKASTFIEPNGWRCHFHYAIAEGPWQKREWNTIAEGTILKTKGGTGTIVPVPAERPIVCYMSFTDDRGALVSTPHVILEK